MRMSEFGNDFVSVIDEDGNEINLEHLGTIEHEGTVYMAFMEALEEVTDLVDADMELIILKVAEEGDEEVLLSIEDENEYDTLYEMFVSELGDMYEDEESDGEVH